jgi:xanthine/uracil permease
MSETAIELLKRLDSLAQTLGTTVEHLWRVLVAQARVEGIILLVILATMIILLTSSIWLARWCWIGHPFWNDDVEIPTIYGGCFIASCVVGAISALILIIRLTDPLTPLLNPEYWALQELMRLMP